MLGTPPELRILHVSAELVFGGIETWLLSMLRLLSTRGMRMDVAVTGYIDPRMQAKFEALGARVLACPSTYQPLRLIRNLRRILRSAGPYDVVHCHAHRGNAHAALAGRLAGVPAIVVHSHLNNLFEFAGGSWTERTKQWAAATLQLWFAHRGLACGRAAGDYLFGAAWPSRANWNVHYCGIDTAPFQRSVNREDLRRRLGIAADAFVIGHVGRFEPIKNQRFILDLATRYLPTASDTTFVFVGDGPLLPALEERARQLGIFESIRVLGARNDVPELLLGVFDAFVLPSLAEGLPISLLEAQAAGLPALMSDHVTTEARILPSVEIVALDRPLEDWCAALDRMRGKRSAAATACLLLQKAGFHVEDSANALEQLYRELS